MTLDTIRPWDCTASKSIKTNFWPCFKSIIHSFRLWTLEKMLPLVFWSLQYTLHWFLWQRISVHWGNRFWRNFLESVVVNKHSYFQQYFAVFPVSVLILIVLGRWNNADLFQRVFPKSLTPRNIISRDFSVLGNNFPVLKGGDVALPCAQATPVSCREKQFFGGT